MLCVRMRREEVSVNLNGMLEVAMVGSLTVSDTISVVVCGQKGTSWESRREGRDGRMEGGTLLQTERTSRKVDWKLYAKPTLRK